MAAKSPSPLAGLVFDQQGERLTATHAQKGTRRYRYYVSHRLIDRLKEENPEGLRIPAQELELAVRQALVSYLTDEHRLVEDLAPADASTARNLIDRGMNLAKEISDGSAAQRTQMFATILERVIVGEDQLQIHISPTAVHENSNSGAEPIVLIYPVQFRRCGLGIRMIVHAPGPRQEGAVDLRLVSALDQAQDWFGRIIGGDGVSTSTIAEAEGLSSSYVVRVIYLAFLAPDIKDAIRRGTQPITLTVDQLMRQLPLPIRWDEQRTILGIQQ